MVAGVPGKTPCDHLGLCDSPRKNDRLSSARPAGAAPPSLLPRWLRLPSSRTWRSVGFLAFGWGLLSAAPAKASYLVIPDPHVAEATSAYKYANMTGAEALAELDKRKIPYKQADPIDGLTTPVRLTGKLHGVWVHSSIPESERATSVYEVLDARLALALDDFCKILERHDIEEVVHYSLYRPNVPKEHHGVAAEGVKIKALGRAPSESAAAPQTAQLPARHGAQGAKTFPAPVQKPAAVKSGLKRKAPWFSDKSEVSPFASLVPSEPLVLPFRMPFVLLEGDSEPSPTNSFLLGAGSSAKTAILPTKIAPKSKTPSSAKASAPSAAKPTEPSFAKSTNPVKSASPAKGASPANGTSSAKGASPMKGASPTKGAVDSAAKGALASTKTNATTAKTAAIGGPKLPVAEALAKTPGQTSTIKQAASGDAAASTAAPVSRQKWAPPGTRHPAGLAIDVAMLKKRDGQWISVARHFQGKIGAKTCGDGVRTADTPEARELRSIVCESNDLGVFTYVLTPNFNAAHFDHFHMEIRPTVKWFLYQ